MTKEQLLVGTREITEIYAIANLNVPELRDPDDSIVLATAIASNSEVIITGDQDLLVLANHENIKILTAKDFIKKEGA